VDAIARRGGRVGGRRTDKGGGDFASKVRHCVLLERNHEKKREKRDSKFLTVWGRLVVGTARV